MGKTRNLNKYNPMRSTMRHLCLATIVRGKVRSVLRYARDVDGRDVTHDGSRETPLFELLMHAYPTPPRPYDRLSSFLYWHSTQKTLNEGTLKHPRSAQFNPNQPAVNPSKSMLAHRAAVDVATSRSAY